MQQGWTTALTMALALLMVGSEASAQPVDRHGAPYRTWDVAVGGGVHGMSGDDMVPRSEPGWDSSGGPSWLWSVTVGRNWTGHFKTELGYAGLSERGWSNRQQIVPRPNGTPAWSWWSAESRVNQVVLGGTWQFGDNDFVHPFISSGVRVALLDITETGAYIEGQGSVRTARRWQEVRPRGYVSAGSKSYFNERLFMRPEVVVAFSPSEVQQVGVHLTFGVDF